MKRIRFILVSRVPFSSALEAPKRRRKHPTIGGRKGRETEKLRKGKERKRRDRGRCKAHSSISLSFLLFLPLPPLEISPHTYARNIQRSVAALGGFNPSKLIPFSRSIAHSLCFVLHQLGYAQLPLFPSPIYSPPKSSFPFLPSFYYLSLVQPSSSSPRSHVPLPSR